MILACVIGGDPECINLALGIPNFEKVQIDLRQVLFFLQADNPKMIELYQASKAGPFWKKSEVSKALWSSLLLSKDEQVVQLIVSDTVLLPDFYWDRSNPWCYFYLFKIVDQLKNISDPDLKQFFLWIVKQLKNILPY